MDREWKNWDAEKLERFISFMYNEKERTRDEYGAKDTFFSECAEEYLKGKDDGFDALRNSCLVREIKEQSKTAVCKTCGCTFALGYEGTKGYLTKNNDPDQVGAAYEKNHCGPCALKWHQERWTPVYEKFKAERVKVEDQECDNRDCRWYKFFYDHVDKYIGPASGEVHGELRAAFREQETEAHGTNVCRECNERYNVKGPNCFEVLCWNEDFIYEDDELREMEEEDCPECMVKEAPWYSLCELFIYWYFSATYAGDIRRFLDWLESEKKEGFERQVAEFVVEESKRGKKRKLDQRCH